MTNIHRTKSGTQVHSHVVDTSRSAFSRLRPLDINAVRLNDTFWAPRRDTVRLVTLASQYRSLEETGRLDHFRRAAGSLDASFQGRIFDDSDVYKWIEAASWILATDPDLDLQQRVDKTIALVAAAQDDDGYLDTYFVGERAADRWIDLKSAHELYCAGHLIQAAIANHRATGSQTLLRVAVRLADLITQVFAPGGIPGADGHPEIEMALVELARETGDDRYLRQAAYFIDQRGQRPPTISGDPYAQDHAPFREQREVVGHAVRALYLYCGAADVYLESGDETLWETLQVLWADLHAHKIYITGGVGSRHEGEAVGEEYELPNRRAYAETCAAIAEVMWNWRMLLASGEARFADALETALYNGVLSGISLDGCEYQYENPLSSRGGHRRQPWFPVACCPPNIARLLASLPGYLYSTSDGALWVHLYASSTATVAVDGAPVTVRQATEYPWKGQIRLEFELPQSSSFDLMLRIPGWCREASAEVNGEPIDAPVSGAGYLTIARHWQRGDVVEMRLAMPVQMMASHPHVLNDHGRVALTRGPLVYCLEQADHPDADVWDVSLDRDPIWTSHFEPDVLGGIVVLRAGGSTRDAASRTAALYVPYNRFPAPARRVSLTAIPYYSWANREVGPMQVWLPAPMGFAP